MQNAHKNLFNVAVSFKVRLTKNYLLIWPVCKQKASLKLYLCRITSKTQAHETYPWNWR